MLETTIRFFVPGRARPGGSKTPVYNNAGEVVGFRDASDNQNWRHGIALACRQAYSGPVLDEPLMLMACFWKMRPKNHYRTGKNAHLMSAKGLSTPVPIGIPDTTKLLRAAEDALKGVLWRDDSLIVDQHAFKRYGSVEGVTMYVDAFDEDTALWMNPEEPMVQDSIEPHLWPLHHEESAA